MVSLCYKPVQLRLLLHCTCLLVPSVTQNIHSFVEIESSLQSTSASRDAIPKYLSSEFGNQETKMTIPYNGREVEIVVPTYALRNVPKPPKYIPPGQSWEHIQKGSIPNMPMLRTSDIKTVLPMMIPTQVFNHLRNRKPNVDPGGAREMIERMRMENLKNTISSKVDPSDAKDLGRFVMGMGGVRGLRGESIKRAKSDTSAKSDTLLGRRSLMKKKTPKFVEHRATLQMARHHSRH